MYRIDETDYGYKLTFGGTIDEKTMARWYTAVTSLIDCQTGKFSVLVDMRAVEHLPPAAEAFFRKARDYARRQGMTRSAVILKDGQTTSRLRRLAQETRINRFERYVNAAAEPNWEKVGLDWLVNGVDPDQMDVKALLAS